MRVDSGKPSIPVSDALIQLGSGSFLFEQGGKTVLEAGPTDRISIEQLLNQLRISVNGFQSFLLSPNESKQLSIQGTLNNVSVDKSVTIPISGMSTSSAKLETPGSQPTGGQAPLTTSGPSISQQQLQSQLPQDPFLQHIFNQLQQLTQQMGGSPSTDSSRFQDTPEKLLPAMQQASQQIRSQLDSGLPTPQTQASSNSQQQQESLPDLMNGILQTLGNFMKQIQSGQLPDLQTLGSQMTQAFQQIPGAVPQNAQPGNIPMEARQLPPGVDQKKAAEKSKEINEAIKSNNMDKIRDLAKDKEAMAMASPAEKAELLRALSADTTSSKDEKKTEQNKAAINFVLRSASNGQEFRSLLQSAGPQVQQALMTGVKDPKADKHLADFNVATGAFGATEYATDPTQAKIATDAMAKGYTPQQILEARDKMARSNEANIKEGKFGRSDGEIKEFSEDPICMAVSTPQEKSGMIKQLMDGYTTGSEDRAMVSILQSANSKEEYEQIVNGAGGKKIVEEMDNDEAKKKFDLLAGAYDRPDLAMDPATAEKARGALTNPARTQYLMGGADQNVVQPQAVDPSKAVSPQNANDPLMSKTDQFIANQNSKIQAQVNTLDRRAAVETVLENATRDSEGKPLMNPRDVRNEVNSVMNQPGLDKDKREEKVEELRKKHGLSEYTMRNIATQPISHIYNQATVEAAGFMNANSAPLEEDVKRAEARYGKESPQAKQAKSRLEQFQSRIGPHTANLQRIGSELGEMYPPPKDFLECLGDFLLGALKAFGPLLLNLIPGVGTTLFAGYQAVKTVMSAVQGDVLGVIGGVAGFLPGVGNLVGGAAGQVIQSGKQTLETGLSVVHGVASGNVLELANAAGGIAGEVSKITGELGQFGTVLKQGLDVAREGLDLGKGILGGDLNAISKGAGMVADQMDQLGGAGSAFSSLANYTRQGIDFANSFQKGDYAAALQKVGVDVRGVLNHPIAQEIAAYSEKGISFANNVSNGNYAGALSDLSGGLSGINDPLAREIAARTQQGSQFLTDLSNGNYAAALNGFDGALGSFVSGPAVQEVTSRIQQFNQLSNDVKNGDFASAVGLISRETGLPLDQAANTFIRDARGLLQGVASSDFRKSFESLAAQGTGFLNSTEFQKYLQGVTTGSDFVRGIASGEFVQKLENLKTKVEAQHQLIQKDIKGHIQNVLNLSNDAQYFVQKSLNQEFWNSVQNMNRDLRVSTALEFSLAQAQKNAGYFQALVSGNALQAIQQYSTNLTDFQERMQSSDVFRRFENEARSLMSERGLNQMLAEEYKNARQELVQQNRQLGDTVKTMQALAPAKLKNNVISTKTNGTTSQSHERSLEQTMREAQLRNTVNGQLTRLPGLAQPGEGAIAASAVKGKAVDQTVLKLGSKGPEVEELQKQINEWRIQNGRKAISFDGKYGNETNEAVREFQKINGLQPDGDFGPRTKDRLKLENDPNFQKLDSTAQKEIRDFMTHHSTQAKTNSADDPNNQHLRQQMLRIATDPNFNKLSSQHQKQLLAAYAKNPGDEIYVGELKTLLAQKNFHSLDEGIKSNILSSIHRNADTSRYASQMANMVNEEQFGKLSANDQMMAVNVFEKTNYGGRESFQKLLHDKTLTKVDSTGKGNTLQHLYRVANSRIPSTGAELDRTKFLENMMDEIANPDVYLRQGDRGTCTATSISYGLIKRNPAEYARLTAELATSGSAKMANGDSLHVPKDAWAPDKSGRSDSERLLQSSLMAYGHPQDEYSNVHGHFINQEGKKVQDGLNEKEEVQVMKALHNKNYKFSESSDKNEMLRNLERELKEKSPVLADITQGTGAHAIQILRIENGRVYYQDPNERKFGESMSVEDFKKRLMGFYTEE